VVWKQFACYAVLKIRRKVPLGCSRWSIVGRGAPP